MISSLPGLRALALLGSLVLVATGAAGCHSVKSPELRVVGVHEEPRHDVVFVQVTNPASHPMRLTKLEYTFAAEGATVSEGEVSLAREVPAGAAVVVEIPLESPSEKPLTLSGKLTAELNQIVQIFSVSAQIEPAK
ncbi:MAG TPA: LEA type 2 family protein [Kofleriaceae bacterium]|nr:LEA type 2 family protein [Kofleriaceae bacterium]